MTDDANDALPQPGAPESGTAADTPTDATTPAADATAPAATEPPTVEAAAEAPAVEEPAAAASTAEIPTAAATAPVTAVPVATAPVAAEPARRSGITVPTWVAALIGAAIVFALGFGIGYGVGDDHDGGNRAVQGTPGFGFNGQMPNGGQMPFGGQFGNGNNGGNGGGNGQMPFGRNGNGNNGGNGSNGGNGNGGSTTATVFLGVAAQDSTSPEGAELARVVAGSPAADAGLKAGDVITKFDGESISSASDLTAAVHGQKPGATVTITYTRDGQSDTTQATLAGSSDFSSQ